MNDLRDWVHERVAAGQNLTRPELATLASDLAKEPHFWSDRVRHDPNTRYFNQLYRDANLDIWLICWLDAQDTGYHDHELSSGAVFIVEGRLHEDYFYRDSEGWIEVRTRERPAGTVFDFDGASIHGLRHAGGPPATSIHCYSPALWRMGYYESGDVGVRRAAITYADELGSGASSLEPANAAD
jgi:hypothetical protein